MMHDDVAKVLWIMTTYENSHRALKVFCKSLARILDLPRLHCHQSFRGWVRKVTEFDWSRSAEGLARSPKRWGPFFWRMMEQVARASQGEQYVQFLHALQPLLPCAKCAKHMKEGLQRANLRLPPLEILAFLKQALKSE